MKPTAFLINLARGPVVKQSALVEALRRGQIAGAGLDVFEVEPIRDNPFVEFENVVMTPHLGGSTEEARERTLYLALTNVCNVLNGRPPHIRSIRTFVSATEEAGMLRDEQKSFLLRLLEAPSPSGFEEAAARIWREEASRFADDVWVDHNGNSYARLRADTPTVLIEGHIDEIGLMVTHIDDQGFSGSAPSAAGMTRS
jgi:hypothetical protein